MLGNKQKKSLIYINNRPELENFNNDLYHGVNKLFVFQKEVFIVNDLFIMCETA